MSFHSHDSDDGDSEQRNASDIDSNDGGSSELILPHYGGPWEMKKVNTIWVGCGLIILSVSGIVNFPPVYLLYL